MLESRRLLRHNPYVPIYDEAFGVGNSSVIHTWPCPRCEFLDLWIGNLDRSAQGLALDLDQYRVPFRPQRHRSGKGEQQTENCDGASHSIASYPDLPPLHQLALKRSIQPPDRGPLSV